MVAPIRRQEPGHFAFYALSARAMVQRGVLAPWQLHLARVVRSRSFDLVGVRDDQQRAQIGGVVHALGLHHDLRGYARQISLLERELLWAGRQGMAVPGYVMRALADAVEAHRAQPAPTT